MKVSIVTVVLNNVSTLSSAIQSVINQTYPEIEYIVIDGGSTDGSIEIIENYTEKISKYISEVDNGIYDAMNKGIKLATGEVIGILNSDDLYTDEYVIDRIMTYFKEDHELDIVYGNIVYVSKENTNSLVRKWNSRPYYSAFFEHGNVPPHPALFLRSRVYKEGGIFNEKYKLAADYELMLRIFKKHNFKSKYINELIIKMRLGGSTNKSFKNILNGNKEIIRAWKDNELKVPLMLMPLRIVKRLSQFFLNIL